MTDFSALPVQHPATFQPLQQRSSALGRIGAIVMRHWFLLRSSWARSFEMLFWPLVNVVTWVFLTNFLKGEASYVAKASGVFIGAVILWETSFRGQIGVIFCFLEEIWSRNLGHLFVSPLRPWEWVAGMMLVSIVRTLISIIPAALLAWALADWNIFTLGLPLVSFFFLALAMGWSLSLMTAAAILRYGMGAEGLAWMAGFIIMPISAVYVPLNTLPELIQPISILIPTTWVFEGMRGVMQTGSLSLNHLLYALGLDLVWLGIGVAIFIRAYRGARKRGALMNVGE